MEHSQLLEILQEKYKETIIKIIAEKYKNEACRITACKAILSEDGKGAEAREKEK